MRPLPHRAFSFADVLSAQARRVPANPDLYCTGRINTGEESPSLRYLTQSVFPRVSVYSLNVLCNPRCDNVNPDRHLNCPIVPPNIPEETALRTISLIDFPESHAEDLAALSAHLGFGINRQEHADEIPGDTAAVFVCGDRTGWLEKICRIREAHRRMFVVIATREPDHEKWLDALEAGANDYCCAPLDTRQFEWLLRRDTGTSVGRTTAGAAS